MRNVIMQTVMKGMRESMLKEMYMKEFQIREGGITQPGLDKWCRRLVQITLPHFDDKAERSDDCLKQFKH